MAQTASTMLPLGTPTPDFNLPEPATGKAISLGDFQSTPALLVMVICNHCPFVKHIRQGLVQFAQDYHAKGLAIVAISARSPTSGSAGTEPPTKAPRSSDCRLLRPPLNVPQT